MQNVIASNVTKLHTPEQILEIYAICGLKSSPVTYQAKVIPVKRYPTTQPYSQPTTIPLPPPTIRQHLVTIHFIGYLFIILVLACLRCAPVIIACCTKDLAPKRSHLYDILVILNDSEEAVFQNVRHEDIVFSRRCSTSCIRSHQYVFTFAVVFLFFQMVCRLYFLLKYDMCQTTTRNNLQFRPKEQK